MDNAFENKGALNEPRRRRRFFWLKILGLVVVVTVAVLTALLVFCDSCRQVIVEAGAGSRLELPCKIIGGDFVVVDELCHMSYVCLSGTPAEDAGKPCSWSPHCLGACLKREMTAEEKSRMYYDLSSTGDPGSCSETKSLFKSILNHPGCGF